jgi:phospholipid-transporting ATPase
MAPSLMRKASSRRESHAGGPEWAIAINSGQVPKHYAGNATRTTKYTLITFLPKALFEQYR